MNQDDSPQRPPAHNGDTTGVVAANTQWHDAELALKVARHSFDRWLVAGHQDTPSLAIMHAHHTHVALHEAARAITMLVHPAHPDTPTADYPAPASLHIPRAQQRPMTIRPPSPGRAGVRNARLATTMATRGR